GEKVVPAEPDTVRHHLALLLSCIQAGCRLGLAQHLSRVPAETVRALLAEADPGLMTEAEYAERCRAAGEAVTLAALISEYRDHLRLLQDLDEDVLCEAAALELSLIHVPTREVRQ